MRPVDKGASPALAFAEYGDAIGDLEGRLGRYCSYCERRLETHLAVEHVQPKSLVPGLALTWANFLLACVNCNSCKGNTPVNVPDYLWPDLDNTLRAFRYSAGGLVDVDPTISPPLHTLAATLRSLVGLDRVPGAAVEPTENDLRWNRRREAWDKAARARQRLMVSDTVELREQIAETAQESGMFSIWWEVFSADIDMRRRLRLAFVGTCATSFNAEEDLQARPGGQL